VTNKQKTKVIIALKTEPYLRAVKINVIIAKHCDEYVRLCVCLSAMISPEPHARSLPIFVHVAYVHGSVLLRHVDDRPHRLSAGRE